MRIDLLVEIIKKTAKESQDRRKKKFLDDELEDDTGKSKKKSEIVINPVINTISQIR